MRKLAYASARAGLGVGLLRLWQIPVWTIISSLPRNPALFWLCHGDHLFSHIFHIFHVPDPISWITILLKYIWSTPANFLWAKVIASWFVGVSVALTYFKLVVPATDLELSNRWWRNSLSTKYRGFVSHPVNKNVAVGLQLNRCWLKCL